MTKNLNKELKNYYHDIEALLPCKRGEKRAVMASIKSAVEGYIYDNPNSSFDDIVKQIGTPNQVVDEYYSPEKAKEFAEQIKRSKIIGVIAAVVAVLIVVLLSMVLVSQFYDGSGHIENVTFRDVSDSDKILTLDK